MKKTGINPPRAKWGGLGAEMGAQKEMVKIYMQREEKALGLFPPQRYYDNKNLWKLERFMSV